MTHVAIVSHDAGGAELISSYVKRKIDNIYLYVLSGPAVKIFERKLGFETSLTVDHITLEFLLQEIRGSHIFLQLKFKIFYSLIE